MEPKLHTHATLSHDKSLRIAKDLLIHLGFDTRNEKFINTPEQLVRVLEHYLRQRINNDTV